MVGQPPGITIERHTGPGLKPFLAEAARLRMAIFREWPYLYEGDAVYESEYLETYSRNPESLFVVARSGAEVIGISTGVPLRDETEDVRAPFAAAGMDPSKVFYFGESVLLPAWRGRGIGVRFFEERENYTRTLPGIHTVTFCAVERPAIHPLRPADYRPLDDFWMHRGFHKTTLKTTFSWKELGENSASPKDMTFWLKSL